MRYLKYFFNLLLIFLIIIFFLQNSEQLSQRVQFHFDLFVPGMVWQLPELPLYFIIIMFFALGGIITLLFFAWSRVLLGRQLAKGNKKIKALEKEITAYRQLPLTTNEILREETKPVPVQPAEQEI